MATPLLLLTREHRGFLLWTLDHARVVGVPLACAHSMPHVISILRIYYTYYASLFDRMNRRVLQVINHLS